MEGGYAGEEKQTLECDEDLERRYVNACSTAPEGVRVIAQNIQSSAI